MRLCATLLTLVLLLVSCQPPAVPSKSAAPAPRINPDPALTLATSQADWYKDQVFYHVWLKAFRDSDGSGIGDIGGVTEKLPYLQDLGVTALWLSPFFQNASGNANLHGYDVTDHYRVDPRFGTLNDVKELLKAAHARGMRVIFDFVPNHVSNQHPWFVDSLNNRNGKKDWFVWRLAKPTSGWADFSGVAGSGFHPASNGQYYYGIFWDGMPDLNYRNPAVQTSMEDVAAFWLNLGFDGLRVDAVKYLFENETTGATVDQPETLAWFQKFRKEVLDPYAAAGAAKFMVAENWTGDGTSLQSYLRSEGKDGFQATLDFPQGEAITNVLNGGAAPESLENLYKSWVKSAMADNGWTFSFLTNHDNYQSRLLSAFGSVQKARVAQALQAASWGTPVLYYGNELGMTGVSGVDGNLRTNLDWSKVAAAQADPDSLLQWQKTLDQLRAGRASLRRGAFQVVPSTPGTAALVRTLGTESTLMVANLTPAALTATADLAGLSPGPSIGVLVGDVPGLSGTSLTVTGLEPFGVRFYALEGPAATLRSGFTDGAPPTKVWAGAKDGSGAVLTVSFYDAAGTLLGTRQPVYTGIGGYWWASFPVPATVTAGSIEWAKPSTGYVSPRLPFTVPSVGSDVVLGFPHYNTGSSSSWYLRGVGGDWTAGVPMAAVAGDPGHFTAVLSPSQAPAAGVQFKINAQNGGQWDYFFGYLDVVYDETLGDPSAGLGYGSAGGGDDNITFRGDGIHAYEVHFVNQKGICRLGIKKALP